MAVLIKEQIIELINNQNEFIEPFSEDQCEPASYDLKLGHILKAGVGKLELRRGEDITLKGGEWALVMSEEAIELPLDLCATYGLRSSVTRKGLMYFGGPQIDPGYKGRLFVSIYNPTIEPLVLRYGDPLFTIIFQRLDQPSKVSYQGRYQGQYDFPSEDVERMMAMRSRTFSEMYTKVDELDHNINMLADSLNTLKDDVHEIRDSIVDSKDFMKRISISLFGIITVAMLSGIAALIKYLFS